MPEQFQASDGATERQVKFIKDLLDQKDLFKSPKFFDAVNAMDAEELAQHIEWLKNKAESLTKQQASGWIAALVKLPAHQNPLVRKPAVDVMKGRTRVEYETIIGDDKKERKIGKIILEDGRAVLEGSYGVDTSGDSRFTNDISFFRVWIAEGYGKGWGVKMYTSDYTHRVSLALPTQVDAIKRIADDPLGAAKLFGHEFKRCGICYRGLTKDESRAAGIGPVCGARMGIHVY